MLVGENTTGDKAHDGEAGRDDVVGRVGILKMLDELPVDFRRSETVKRSFAQEVDFSESLSVRIIVSAFVYDENFLLQNKFLFTILSIKNIGRVIG